MDRQGNVTLGTKTAPCQVQPDRRRSSDRNGYSNCCGGHYLDRMRARVPPQHPLLTARHLCHASSFRRTDHPDLIETSTTADGLHEPLSHQSGGTPRMAPPHISARWRVGPTSYLVRPPLPDWRRRAFKFDHAWDRYHETPGSGERDLLSPLRDPRHLQPVRDWRMVTPLESAALAQRLIAETCATQGIGPGQLTKASPWRCCWRISG